MANFPNQQLTNEGWDALSFALAGQRLTFTRMAIGDGQLPDGANLEAMTALEHYVMDARIIDYRAAGQGMIFIVGELRSALVDAGFYLREIGLYCTLTPVGSTTPGPEILYSINNTGTQSDYIPGKTEANIVIQAIEVQVLISKAEDVQVEVIIAEATLIGENVGGGAGIFKQRTGNRFQLRTLISDPTSLLPIEVTEEIDTVSLAVGLGAGGGGPGTDLDDGTGAAPPVAIAPGIGIIETGVCLPFTGRIAPRGYLIANGRAVSRTGYAGLFAVIGTDYGDGDGNSTFNIPDLRDRVPVGIGTVFNHLGHRRGSFDVILTSQQIPSHAHNVDISHTHDSIITGNHTHGDPGHAHSVYDGWHAHNIAIYSGGIFGGGGVSGLQAHPSYIIGTAGAWSGVSTTYGAGSGLYAAGNTGGYTGAASDPSKITMTVGGDQPHENTQPSLGIHYIIKT